MANLIISNVRTKPYFGGEELITKLLVEKLSNYYNISYLGYSFNIVAKYNIFPFSRFLPRVKGISILLRKIRILKYFFVKKLNLKCDLLISNSNSDDLAVFRGYKQNIFYDKIIVIKHGPNFEFGKVYPDPLIKNRKFKILVLNSTDLKELSSKYGNENVELLHLGINVDTKNNFSDVTYLKSLGITDESKVIFSIGRLEEKQKGFLNGILAMKEIIDKTKNKEHFVYLIAGSGKDEKLYQKLISKLNLQDNVKLLGRISDDIKHQIYVRADFVLQQSISESFSLVALEALKYGKILLVSKNKGSFDIIKSSGPNQNAFFIERDPKQIADLLISILANFTDSDLNHIKDNARKTGDIFTEDKMLIQIKEVINKMLNN